MTTRRRPGWPPRPGWLDLGVAAAVGVFVVLATLAAAGFRPAPRPLDAFTWVLVAVVVGALLWRRAAPLAALGGVVGGVGCYLLLGYPYGPIQLCMALAMFEVARRRELRTSLIACGVAAAAVATAVLLRLGTDSPLLAVATAVSSGCLLVVPWSLGALVQVRTAATQRARRELVAMAAIEERMRLAREVHDVAGHGFAVVAMQAGVALLVFQEQPEQARRSLEAIQTASTQALAELRATLEEFGAPEETGLAGLRAMVDGVRAGGLVVDLRLECEPVALPKEVDIAVYRVVQESLTNVLRHAGPTAAAVRIAQQDNEITVEVADRGGGPIRPNPAGRGLAGMRARVEAAGGSFESGPRQGGGFQVSARLPREGARS